MPSFTVRPFTTRSKKAVLFFFCIQPVSDGKVAHKDKVPIITKDRQVVETRYSSNLSITGRDRLPFVLLLCLNPAKFLSRSAIVFPENY